MLTRTATKMEDFDSAEGVTRFLRNKNTPPDVAVATARRLLAGEYSLYLPNSAMFVFDLVCDRISDFSGKHFITWKFCPELWSLWIEVWDATGSGPLECEIRAKSFGKVRVVFVAIAVLDEIAAKVSSDSTLSLDLESLIKNLFLCLQTFSVSGYIHVEEFSAMGLLKSYSSVLLALNPQPLRELPVDEWSIIIGSIYELPHQHVTYKPSKKSMAKYFKDVLPIHVTILGKHEKLLPQQSYKIIHSIFTSVLFDLERNSLPAQIAVALDSPPNFLEEQGILFLFRETILNLASSDIAACESIYIKLTAGKFAPMAEKLITVLSKVNKALSSDFFREIYVTEIGKSKPNWKLLSNILRLDPELTISKWKEVISGCVKESQTSLIDIADNISMGFVRSRDYPFFVSEVFPFALSVSDQWKSHEVIAKLAPKVNEMSGNQIAKVCKQFLDAKSLTPLSLLVQGLLFCPLAKQKSSQTLFEDASLCHPGWSEIAYYALCVFGEPLFKTSPDLITKILGKRTGIKTNTDLDLVLRVAELTGKASNVEAKQVTAFIKSMESSHLIPFAKRWIVIMGLFTEAYAEWLKKAFKELDSSCLMEYMQHQQALLCELPSFLNALSTVLQKSSYSYTNKLMMLFPPLVLRKYFAESVADVVTNAIKSPQDAGARRTLRHIFEEPVLSSDLEKDFDLLRKLVSETTEETQADSFAVAQNIWVAHMRTLKSPQSKSYVQDAVKALLGSLERPSETDLALSRVILTSDSSILLDDFESYLGKYVSVVCKRLETKNLETQISGLSELPNLTQAAKTEIKKVITKFGATQISPLCRVKLFALVAKTYGEEESEFVFALYLALRQNCEIGANKGYRTMLDSSLKAFVQNISVEAYIDIFAYVIKSLRQAPIDFVDSLVDAGTVLLPFLHKESESSQTHLLVGFISAFTECSAQKGDPTTIISFVSTLTDIVSVKSWAFKQYAVELVLGIAHLIVHKLDYGSASEKVYLSTVKLVSFVVLYHRFRFSSRYHLVVRVVSDMMLPFSDSGVLRGSSKCAAAYTRLLTSLCEPSSHVSMKSSDSLTSRAASFRRDLRAHAHVLLINYIYIRLKHRFSSEVNDSMMPGIYSLFSLLSKAELSLANACLDDSGRAYYQTLYSTYKDHGKWKE